MFYDQSLTKIISHITIQLFMAKKMYNDNGSLNKDLLPAMYLDSSVVIDYWMTEGLEMQESEDDKLIKENEPPQLSIIREIIKADKRVEKVIEIRKKILFEKIKVTPIISPLTIIELSGWQAEYAFKQIASDTIPVTYLQKQSKKRIGDFLKIVLELHQQEYEDRKKQGKEDEGLSTGLQLLLADLHINPSFANCHGLQGLCFCDILNFNMFNHKVWGIPSLLAYLQLGLADIMHILYAKHLGCEYIASFDSDFNRASEILKDELGLTVLSSPKEVLNIL